MTKLGINILFIMLMGISLSTQAQQGKFKIIGYVQDAACPIFRSVDKKTGDSFYDSRVIGYPRFFPGYIITLDGEKIEGRIALFNNQIADWAFVKKCMLIIPEEEEEAQYIGGNAVAVIQQQQKKENVYYDLYEGGYLERLVSGKLRLSYNPNANTSRKVSEFVSQSFIDSMRANTARKSVKESLKDGKSLQESIQVAALKDELINIGAAVEIVDKEYLLYDEQKATTLWITKTNYEQAIQQVLGRCPSMDEKTIKGYARKYDKIADAITEYNEKCK
ncbi:MAG TPA: hypothetical protein DIS90_05130 [Cytophagales bacterium]|nr:hypothetical protein [Cytophagales bacterium]